MPLLGHHDVALLNDVANDAESAQKSKITIIIAESERMGKLINSSFDIKFTRLGIENAG